MPVGRVVIRPADLSFFLLLLVRYYRAIDSDASSILAYEQANLMAHITMVCCCFVLRAFQVTHSTHPPRPFPQELEASSNGSTIFVGHDTNLDAAAVLLNLTWNAPPYG